MSNSIVPIASNLVVSNNPATSNHGCGNRNDSCAEINWGIDPATLLPYNLKQLKELGQLERFIERLSVDPRDLVSGDISFAVTSDGEKPKSWINAALNSASGAIETFKRKVFPGPTASEIRAFAEAVKKNDDALVDRFLGTRKYKNVFSDMLNVAIESRKTGFIVADDDFGASIEMIGKLTKAAVSIDKEEVYFSLFKPIEWRFKDVVKVMLKNGAPIEIGAVAYAIELKESQIVQDFIDAGLDIYLLPAENLYNAIYEKDYQTAKVLIKAGMDVNYNLDTIIIAIDSNDLELVKLLIESGAKIKDEYYDAYPQDLIRRAVAANNIEMIRIFLKAKFGTDYLNAKEVTNGKYTRCLSGYLF